MGILKAPSVLLLFVLFLTSCSKHIKETTDLPKPVIELISSFDDCACDPYINKYLWKDKIVYVLAYTGPACDWIPRYYNEKGEEFNMQAGYALDNFLRESKLLKNIWACK